MIIRTISILVITFVVSSCKQSQTKENIVMPNNSFKYIALGDSYTIGEGVKLNDTFPTQLKDSLTKAKLPLETLHIVAQTGWTTSELMQQISNIKNETAYNLVTLLIGVNDQYHGHNIEDYRKQFQLLLKKAIGLAGGKAERVIVISIPDWSVTPFASNHNRNKIADEIDLYNSVNLKEAQQAGVYYVNVTDISRQAKSQPELIASDGLHPSGIMYKHWVDEFFPLAFQILKNQLEND